MIELSEVTEQREATEQREVTENDDDRDHHTVVHGILVVNSKQTPIPRVATTELESARTDTQGTVEGMRGNGIETVATQGEMRDATRRTGHGAVMQTCLKIDAVEAEVIGGREVGAWEGRGRRVLRLHRRRKNRLLI